MPEGDTVFRTAARLHQALAGEPLTTSDLRWPELSTLDFRGVTTVEVVSRGKNILQRLGNGVTIHSHLRMEGQWRVDATDRVTPRSLTNPQIRAVVATRTWTAMGLRLGDLHAVETADEDRLVGHLGPDVLGPDWDPEEAARRLHDSPTTVGAALLDQRNLAGVGTLYAAETLFLERVNPWTPAADLDAATLASVVRPRAYPARRRPTPRDPDDHRQPASGRDRLGARPVRPPLPALRGDPAGGHGRRGSTGAHDVLLPPVPGRPSPLRRRSTAASTRNGHPQRPRARRPRAPSLTPS